MKGSIYGYTHLPCDLQVPVHEHMCTSVCIYFYTLYADGKMKVLCQCLKKKPRKEEMGILSCTRSTFLLFTLPTVKSFVALVKFMFTVPGVTCLLREKLCQDPLERFFGCQRQRGGVNENPTAQEFCTNTQALRVVNSFCQNVSRENRQN